ncbi:MAG: gfo/Idh/MocA family oxidoreductase, partial [Chloroflexi bacterium]
YGGKAYMDYRELLADPNVDIVYNPLPNHLHKEWSIKAAQAGKHVLCEKPIALNAADATEMVATFRGAGLKLAEAFQWRHHPQGLRMRELLVSGVIGEARMIDAGFSFMLTRPDDVRWVPAFGGGSLYDVGCYPISFVRFIMGMEPTSVTAQIHWNESGVDDLVVATLEFPNGVLAHINCSFILPLRRYYEVIGSTGGLYSNKTYNPRGDGETILRMEADRQVVETIPLPQVDSYVLMAEDFNMAILANRPTTYPAEDAIANMQVIDAIFMAAREGRCVDVGTV